MDIIYLDDKQTKSLHTQTMSVLKTNTFYKDYEFSGEPKESSPR